MVGLATPALVSILTPQRCNKSMPRIISGSIKVGATRNDTVVVASFHSNGSLAVLPSTKIGVFSTPITCAQSCTNGPTSTWYLLYHRLLQHEAVAPESIKALTGTPATTTS